MSFPIKMSTTRIETMSARRFSKTFLADRKVGDQTMMMKSLKFCIWELFNQQAFSCLNQSFTIKISIDDIAQKTLV